MKQLPVVATVKAGIRELARGVCDDSNFPKCPLSAFSRSCPSRDSTCDTTCSCGPNHVGLTSCKSTPQHHCQSTAKRGRASTRLYPFHRESPQTLGRQQAVVFEQGSHPIHQPPLRSLSQNKNRRAAMLWLGALLDLLPVVFAQSLPMQFCYRYYRCL